MITTKSRKRSPSVKNIIENEYFNLLNKEDINLNNKDIEKNYILKNRNAIFIICFYYITFTNVYISIDKYFKYLHNSN